MFVSLAASDGDTQILMNALNLIREGCLDPKLEKLGGRSDDLPD
jgi:hypothetical protein